MSEAQVSDPSDQSDRSDKRQQPITENESKLKLIEMGLQAFLEQFLPEEAMPQLVALWEAAEQCPELNLTRGAPDTWAAAIAYAFARMNFLLDDPGELHIDRAEFFTFFEGCNKSTVTQKATKIEKTLDFGYGHPDFCLPQVVDAMPKFVQLPNGMVAPEALSLGKSSDGQDIKIEFMDEEESKELERQLAEQQRAREEEKTRQRHEKLRRKREEESKTQPDLFDFGD